MSDKKYDRRWGSNFRFIKIVIEESIRRGYGLVPFTGSGLSAPSGILIGMQFGEYIAWTVYRCVSGEHGSDPEGKSYWNLEAAQIFFCKSV